MTKDTFPAPARRLAPVAVVVLLALIAIAFTSVNLGISRHIGRLSNVPNYDDVVYLNSASKIYHLTKEIGLRKAATVLFGTELHAPFPVLNGLAGFFLFGTDVNHVYYMLAVVVLTYLLFAAAVTRGPPLAIWIGLTLSTLALPFATMCALEFRPDLMWATMLGGSCVLFLTAPRPFDSWKASVLYGVALGLVLLIKPSTFAMTLLVMGGTWFLAAVIAIVGKAADWKQVLKGWLFTLLAMTVVSGWYCVPHAHEILDYFYVNSFGDNKDVWSYKGDLFARLTYYVRDNALQSNTGNLMLLLALLYIGGAIRDIAKGPDLAARLRGGAFLWMLGCLFAVNAVFNMKSPFLGGSFYSYLIFGALWYSAQFLRRFAESGLLAGRWSHCFVASLVLAVGIAGHQFPDASRMNIISRFAQRTINHAILHDLLVNTPQRRCTIVLTQGNPIVGEFLQMEFWNRGKRLTFVSAAFCKDVKSVIDMTQGAQFIALQDQKLQGSPGDAIPGEVIELDLIKAFNANPDWKLIGEYPDQSGRHAYLYERVKGQP